jgi:hypothetical protein
MDDRETIIQWTKQERQEEKWKERDRFRRMCCSWPVISMTTIVFGGLAFLMFDPMRGMVCTIVAFVGSVIVVENFS